ncbi:MAG TPA: hypothetical protein VF182_20170 [Candidatus Binatia bacterium]
MKRSTALWVIILAFFLTAACDQIFDRDSGIFNWPGSARDLEGGWYVNGDPKLRAEIVSTPSGLEARNERGQSTRLDLTSGGSVRALDWEGGLRGTVRRDQIDWQNGTSWTRQARNR